MLEVKNVKKDYGSTKVLNDVSFHFDSGKFYAIMGPSGSGKTTLLNLIGGLDAVTEGDILLNGQSISSFQGKDLSNFRMKNMGFVFQGFYLNPYLNARQNIRMPMLINPKLDRKKREERIDELLERFQLKDREKNMPKQLSGGEQQRIAIARALANQPELILADEPTGNLDEENENIVFTLLKKLSEEGKTVIVVSHNDHVLNYADEVIHMVKGSIKE